MANTKQVRSGVLTTVHGWKVSKRCGKTCKHYNHRNTRINLIRSAKHFLFLASDQFYGKIHEEPFTTKKADKFSTKNTALLSRGDKCPQVLRMRPCDNATFVCERFKPISQFSFVLHKSHMQVQKKILNFFVVFFCEKNNNSCNETLQLDDSRLAIGLISCF